jgi:acyl dehydratase
MGAMIEAGYAGILDGGMAYDYFLPVRAGDTLVASPKVADIALKEGKTKMMIVRFEVAYYNQNGDLVAKAYQTLIGRQL